MKNAKAFAVVMVTAPRLSVARKLARAALERKLIACATILPGVESHYWWQHQLETSKECLLMLKTRRTALQNLERLLLELHPYDTPEIIALPLTAGTERYLDWLRRETAPQD